METEGFYMAEKRWRTWETVGLLVVLAAGNLLHFVYDWTGQSPIVAPLAAVNESTWEHMKLFITPWVLRSLVECIALRGHGALLPARGLGLLTGLAAIPALFYTYQGILGRGIMWVDVLIFQLAVLLAFWVSWSVQARRVLDGPVWQILGGDDAAGGVGAGHLVDLRTAPAAAVRGSHRRKPGHPTAVGLRVGETACKM